MHFLKVECLPMKGVATLKAGGRRKGRVVVCGNYASEKHDEAIGASASGVDSVCVRAMTTFIEGGQRKREYYGFFDFFLQTI